VKEYTLDDGIHSTLQTRKNKSPKHFTYRLLFWFILYLSQKIVYSKMNKILLLLIFVPVFSLIGKAQSSKQEFDTLQFNKHLEFANWLIEYEYYTQLVSETIHSQSDITANEWFSYRDNKVWHTVGGNYTDNSFAILRHIIFDSLNTISDYTGSYDTSVLEASGSALSFANTQFQGIRDTCNLYFNAFVYRNPNQTISIWFLPAFQPSGQAIYGCEWEYIFDRTGRNLLRQNSYTNVITGVWIGQPRELWLNYRNTDNPTVGSVFFVLSFRDYFTRVHIDTRISTSTTTKDASGNYTWTHKMK